jgi:ribonuclease P protein component
VSQAHRYGSGGACWPSGRINEVMQRQSRLRDDCDVRRVFEQGQSWAHRCLVLVARPNGLRYSRVGVTASKRVGNAIARNRGKRLLREAARSLYQRLQSGWDIMLVARTSILKLKEQEVEDALRSLLTEAGLSVWGASNHPGLAPDAVSEEPVG